jgi:transposase
VEDRERSGRPPLVNITHQCTNPITRAINHDRQFTSMGIKNYLHNHNHISISTSTIRRLREQLGYRPVLYRRKVLLDKTKKRKRVQFALDNMDEEWKDVIFTDEKWFVLTKEGVKYWKREDEIPLSYHTPKKPIKVMVWGGVWWDGKTKIKIIEGTVDSEAYRKIINECIVQPHLADYERLLQDNAPAHKSESTLDYLDSKGIELIDPFPPSSPDLNPIESVWSWMKSDVDKQYPTSKEELISCVEKSWKAIPQSTIQGFISHLKTNCNRIIESEGDNTNL